MISEIKGKGVKKMDGINMLNLISQLNSLGGVGSSCSCNSVGNSSVTGSSFDIVLNSLMKAVSEKNKYNGCVDTDNNVIGIEELINKIDETVGKIGEVNKLLDNALPNKVTDNVIVSKIEPTNKDESINIRIKNAVSKASKDYGVDADLIMSIIKVESNFNPNCTSKAGAKGLMQLMPENCKYYGVSNPYDIEENIDAGTRHIKDYIDKYKGDIEMALMAYNGGPTRMANRGVKSINDIYKMPKETQNYVPKVMKLYRGN